MSSILTDADCARCGNENLTDRPVCPTCWSRAEQRKPENRLDTIGTTPTEMRQIPAAYERGILYALAAGDIATARNFLATARGQMVVAVERQEAA